MDLTMARIYRLLCLTILCSLFYSCGKKETVSADSNADDKEIPQVVEIIDGGIVTLKLDLDANFQFLSELRGINMEGKDYVTFYTRNANAIYLYDALTGEIVKKTVMDTEGPNAVKGHFRMSYFYHSIDSIFVNGLPLGLYLVSSDGQVLTKNNLGLHQEIARFDSPKPMFDFASFYKNGKISLATESMLNDIKTNERVQYDFENDLLGEESIKTDLIISDTEEAREIKKERRRRGDLTLNRFRFFSDNGEYLFASHVISDTIYAFQDGELKKSIYAGVPDVDIADYASYATVRTIEKFKNGMGAIENPKQDPQFKNTLMSPDGKWIYRVLYHATKPKIEEGSDRPKPEVTAATLVVLDLETENLTYFELPVNEVELGIPMNRHVFVTSRGIHFRVLDQENEDEVQFRLFRLNR
ncbi:DUF4221 family protein [Roseivirga sp.]|uniref:DUF4221 family protein n=1 Tax=Roseivirga sp. TaxID=1964215 RepID=UPI003B8E69B6